MSKEKSLVEKKLRGSGGFAIAKVSDDEQKMANLGGPELFLAGIGKLDNNRFKKYYCNKCEKEYQGAPNIEFENPNEDLGENIILIEKGEYKCKTCNYVIAQYRKFDESKNEEKQQQSENEKKSENKVIAKDYSDQEEGRNSNLIVKEIEEEEEEESNNYKNQEKTIETSISSAPKFNSAIDLDTESSYVQIEKIIGMLTYDHNAHLVGKVNDIGLRKKSDGRVEFSFNIKNSDNLLSEISWNNISKIGDIIILADKKLSSEDNTKKGNFTSNSRYTSDGQTELTKSVEGKICGNCKFKNEAESVFCEDCGKKLE